MYIPAVVINLDALYIIDKILDNLDFTDWMCCFQLSLSSITMPKNLVAVTLGISALLIFRCSSRSGGLPRNNI